MGKCGHDHYTDNAPAHDADQYPFRQRPLPHLPCVQRTFRWGFPITGPSPMEPPFVFPQARTPHTRDVVSIVRQYVNRVTGGMLRKCYRAIGARLTSPRRGSMMIAAGAIHV